MATLHHLIIKNFRGIQNFDQNFKKGLTCIIGRGDSGKSTILDAISFVLSSSWSLSFYDSDFYNCQTNSPIEIEATLVDVPEKLLAKYGMYVRGVKSDGTIIDDMESDEAEFATAALTINLKVTKDLEPIWSVANYRGQAPASISAIDRSHFNSATISNYSDKHFSLNKGNPLYTLLKKTEVGQAEDEENVILEVLRRAKHEIDGSIAEKFNEVIKVVVETSKKLGISAPDIKASIDHRDISIKENKVCLHEIDVPLRLKGKGSKRLISLAIQLSIAEPNGIILIDEIEQGLEPDRVQHLVHVLKEFNTFQIFFTSHSSNAIVELSSKDLLIMTKGAVKLLNISDELQGCVRNNPDAFFAKRIIVCEGATEVGICRALNNIREEQKKLSFSCLGIVIVDGNGANMLKYASNFKSLGYDVSLFCDSDVESVNNKKQDLTNLGIIVIDCDNGLSIEQQLFNDAMWNVIVSMLEYRITIDGIDSESVFNSMFSQTNTLPPFSSDWYISERDGMKQLLGNKAKEKGWYKRIDHGMKIGELIFQNLDQLNPSSRTKSIFNQLARWIET
jgi:ABC-type branched-subunit amino acid transport system ATPase component